MKKLISLITLAVALVFIGCGGVDSDSGETSSIKVLSPSKSNVDYNYLTLKIGGNISDVIAKVNGVEYIGVNNNSSNNRLTNRATTENLFFIYNVALKKGKNIIEVIANGGSERRTIEINSAGKGIPPIEVNVNKREGFEKLNTTINIQTTLSVSEYMLDKDSDGVIDESKSDANFNVNYTKEGRYFPQVTVKTSDGTLYTTQKYISLDVKEKPLVKQLSTLSNLNVIDMQIFSSDKYYILTDTAVYEVNSTNDIINTININANNPEGFFVDQDENIFIANTGANQIIELSKVNGYQQTMAFGTYGSANGEFNQPKDLVVEGSGEQQKIYVLDAGNNRVQVFNYVGAYLYSFDGSNTPTGKLNNPTSMVGYFAQPLTIVDSGNKVIRTLQCTKGQPEHEISVIKDEISSDIGKITIGNSLIVPDKGAKKLLFFQNNYWLQKSLDVDKVPNIAISHDGLNILVANEGESGIKELQIKPDPKGAEPIDVAKKFVQALIDGDRDTVEKLLGYNERNINFIYSNQDRLNKAIELYKQIQYWKKQIYYNSSYAIVKAHIKTATDEFDTTFELVVSDPQIKTSRVWIVKRFY